VLIGPGPTLKRSMPRAKGSASAIRKRSSHITVVVSDGKAVSTLRGEKRVEAKAEKDSVRRPAEVNAAADKDAKKEEAK
jgi:hypothetical protein